MVDDQVRRRASELPEVEALALFGLTPTAERDHLKKSWREVSLECHPDKALDDAQRAEFHLKFLTYRSAYERLSQAYEDGRLPTGRRGDG